MSQFIFLFLFLSMVIDDLDRIAISGKVRDLTGRAIVGARIVARRVESGLEQTVVSDERGDYRVVNLAPGLYELRAEARGFQPTSSRPLSGLGGETIRFDFRLGPGLITAVMPVSGGEGAIRVDQNRTVFGTTLGRAEIEELPVESRNVLDLALTLPGVTLPGLSDHELAEGDREGSFRRPPVENGIVSLAGGMPYSNNVTIEGLDNNDDREGRERVVPVLAGVAELQVITNQFSAEYGRASGGRINLRLREGERRLHGEIFQYYRDARLNGNGFFRNADPARAERLPFFNLNPGIALGLPRTRWGRLGSRLFLAYEHDYVDDQAEIAALVPLERNPRFPLPPPNGAAVGAGVGLYDLVVRTPRTSHTGQLRGELEVGQDHRIASFGTIARSRDRRGFAGGRQLPETMRGRGRDSQSWSVTEQWTISGRLFNSLRAQWSGLRPVDAPANAGGASPVVLIEIDDPRGHGDRSGTLVAGSSTLGGMERREGRWQLQETLTVARGRQTIRLGFDLHTIDSRVTELTDRSGTWRFDSVADFLANRPARFVQSFGSGSRIGNSYRSIFWQDDWQPRAGLTIGSGLRWEEESVMVDRQNLGPRLALALAPGSGGKSVLRIGGGLFYNRAMLRTIDDYQITTEKRVLDTDGAGQWLLEGLKFPRALRLSDPGVREATTVESLFRRQLEPGLRLPESLQLAIGYERELGQRAKVEFNYVEHRGTHLWRESNINLPRLPAGDGDWASYLLGLELANRPDPLTGRRPYPGSADLIRFSSGTQASEKRRENGGTVVIYGLNSASTSNSTNGLRTARAAINKFRVRPELTQVEELQARGVSRYQGLTVGVNGRGWRLSYTLSRTIDDGVVNTSSPLVAGDFERERTASLLDARHRLVLSWTRRLPGRLRDWSLAGILQASSARPFNIGINGNDRNLDDVGNDRPNFSGDPGEIVWQRPGQVNADRLSERFSLPTIGTVGNLPRNAGRGPAIHTLNLRLTRTIRLGRLGRLGEGVTALALAEAFN
ncbi:MAG: carboxypeptidase regulatory-like domain-containing protein, partial [Acidobacteriota bacterium]